MKKISVIIPVLNREKFIQKCLDSLTSQKGVNLEIIVVDNNSEDQTPQIVKNLAKTHQNIHYYNMKKRSVSAARNLGIKKAAGDYISFVDSDDFCLPGMYKHLLKEAEESGADITVCGLEGRLESGQVLPPENAKTNYYGNSLVRRFLCRPASALGKLIKTEYVREHNIKFRENLSLAEDLVFVSELAAYTTNIAFIDHNYYVYISQSDSLMHNINPEREYQIFEALGYIYGIYDRKVKMLEEYHDELERMFIANLVLSASTRYMIPENDKRFYEQALSFLRTHFSQWYKNKYYAKRGIKVKLFFFLYRKGCILKFRKLITRVKS